MRAGRGREWRVRVFAFLLMLTVGVGGSLLGYRMITGRDLVTLSELGLVQPATPPIVTLTPSPTATAAPRPAPTTTQAVVRPTATPVPDRPQTMIVGNTEGQGVFLRRTPNMNDRLRAWMDGARMEIIGPSVESDGLRWAKVRAPDGAEGYIPEQYLVP